MWDTTHSRKFLCVVHLNFRKSLTEILAAARTRVMRAAVTIPTIAAASVLHSAAVGGSVVGVVRPL